MGPHRADANLAALIESTDDLIWSVDLNYGLLTFNRSFHDNIQRNFGVSSAVEMQAEDLLPPERAALWTPLFDRALSEGAFRLEYSLVDGRTLELAFNRIVQDGETTGISVFGKDITERKRAEAALREAERKYRDMFEGALEGVYRTSLEGKLLAANPALAKMLGYDSAQEVVATITDAGRQVWLDPNGRSRLLQLLERHKVVRGYECQLRRKDGSALWVSLSSRKVCGEDGRALYTEGFIEDITERKEAEARLRAQHERFQRIIENTDAGYFRIGMDGCYEDVNPAWLRMHGFTRREDAIGLHFSAVQVPEDAGNAAAIVGVLKQGEPVRSGEFSRLRRDGTIGYHGFSAGPVLDGDRVTGIEGFLLDITERKAAERNRQHSERQYRSLFNSMQEGVALHRLIRSGGVPDNYILLDVNRRFEELLGMRREHVVERLATEVYGTEAAPYLIEYASVVEGGRPLQFETYFPPLDKHFVISVTPMGEDLFATIFFDVTEQKRTQERYQLISENAADVIWMWDLEEGRCAYVSPSVQQLRGFSPEELMAEPMDQAMRGDTYRMAAGEIQRRRAAVESGDEGARIDTREIELLRKDGTTVVTETVTKLVSDARGEVRYLVGVSRDITGLKRAESEKSRIEDQLRQAQKLESVGRLAGGVAHDFNNLLTVINGYSRLLLGKLKAGDPLRDNLEEIHKAGERAAALTRQLLAFGRKQVLQPRVLDLNRVVGEMRPMLARLMGEDVEVCVQLQAEAATIRADPNQLEQVLMNLAVNSRDAMPRGGKFTIETGFVEWGESQVQSRPGAQAGPYVMLAVSDTGVGMSEETRGHIFEPFFTTKEVGKGTGLGLSTIYGIVEQSGGCVEAESELGRGTTFKIYLPRLVGAEADSEKPETAAASGGHETVLVVEDQAEVRGYAAAALGAYGYQVIQAENAGDALLQCGREGAHIDLVLTDVVMPSMSGRELADRLKERCPGIKVLFMSGYTDDTMVHQGVLQEDAEFIQKPFSPDQLASKVRGILVQGPGSN